jgi:hypothetical protein
MGGYNWLDFNHRIGRRVTTDCPSLGRIVNWCDSVCVVIFPVGEEPFDILLRVNGSSDLVLIYPGVVIPAYSESESISFVVYNFKFPEFPKSNRFVEADWLESDQCLINTGGAVALSKRDDFETTDTVIKFVQHRDLDCNKRFGDGEYGATCSVYGSRRPIEKGP